MIKEYQKGIDRHSVTGKLIIRRLLDVYDRSEFDVGQETFDRASLVEALKHDSLKSRWNIFRQMGKTTNFLILFRGGGYKLRATIADDLNVVMPLPVCEEIVTGVRKQYLRFDEWQNELLAEAKKRFRLELPLLGQSRIFVGSSKVIDDTYTPEICNFPIQTIAATVMLDIQSNLLKHLSSVRPKVHVGLNIYDSIFIDGARRVYHTVMDAVERCFSHPEFYEDLCKVLDREVPIGYDISAYSDNPGGTPHAAGQEDTRASGGPDAGRDSAGDAGPADHPADAGQGAGRDPAHVT
jgi:hypothetical protein